MVEIWLKIIIFASSFILNIKIDRKYFQNSKNCCKIVWTNGLQNPLIHRIRLKNPLLFVSVEVCELITGYIAFWIHGIKIENTKISSQKRTRKKKPTRLVVNFCNNLDLQEDMQEERKRKTEFGELYFPCSFFLVDDLFQGDIDKNLLNARIE